MTKKKPLINAWEVVTCENGHPCYIVVRPIYGDEEDLSGYATQVEETGGETQEICPRCDKPIWHLEPDKTVSIYVKGKKRKGLLARGTGFIL